MKTVTQSQGDVPVCLATMETAVISNAQKVHMVHIAKGLASAWMAATVTPWLALVTALPALLGLTAVKLVLLITTGRTVSSAVPVAQDTVIQWLEGASVHLAEWEPGVSKNVPKQGMAQIVS